MSIKYFSLYTHLIQYVHNLIYKEVQLTKKFKFEFHIWGFIRAWLQSHFKYKFQFFFQIEKTLVINKEVFCIRVK